MWGFTLWGIFPHIKKQIFSFSFFFSCGWNQEIPIQPKTENLILKLSRQGVWSKSAGKKWHLSGTLDSIHWRLYKHDAFIQELSFPFSYSVFLPGKTLGLWLLSSSSSFSIFSNFFLESQKLCSPSRNLQGCTREDAQNAAWLWRSPADRISNQAIPWDELSVAQLGHNAKPHCSPIHGGVPRVVSLPG